jgi:hypothetical protein
MTMTVSPAANFGVNIYPGELVMMQGNTLAPTENGTYKVQNTSGSTVQVTVPSTTPSCTPPSGTCATLYLGTNLGDKSGDRRNVPQFPENWAAAPAPTQHPFPISAQRLAYSP